MRDELNPTRRLALERIKAMILEAVAPYDAAVYLFGSCATGKVRQSSDIDVGILPREPLPGALLAKLADALEESTIPYFVDLVDLSGADPAFRRRVEQEGIAWRR